MRKNKTVAGISYPSDRNGFIYALARRESSADLNKNDDFNFKSQRIINSLGYVGFFQYGTPALIDIGYKTKNGVWTGKNGAISLKAFCSSREIQIAAINLSIDLWCERLRKTGINEYYGKIINGIEITESGCIAGCHLVGLGGLASYLNVPGNLKINKKTGKRHKETDGNGVHISEYVSLLAHYDMGTCCNRKIRISLKDPSGLPLKNKTVKIMSTYMGKHIDSNFETIHEIDTDGELPVIVRHPGAKIILEIDGRKSEEIIQNTDKVQPYTIIASDMKVSAFLAKKGNPEPKKQIESEQLSSQNISKPEKNDSQDINFNIAIVEGDSGKPISNVKFTLIYKDNSKQHITNGSGVKENIVAELGEKIQVCIAGEGNLQPITSFTVTESIRNTTFNVSLPIHIFDLLIIDMQGKPVANMEFSIFYRGKERIRKTDSKGRLKIKALVGFVYRFGNKDNPLLNLRCLQSVSIRQIIVNSAAIKATQKPIVETTQQILSGTVKPSSSPKTENLQNKSEEKQKVEQPKPSQPEPVKQKNTYTEKNGNPLTVVGEENYTNLNIKIVFSNNVTEYQRNLVSNKTKKVLIELAKLAGKKQLVITKYYSYS